MTVWSPAAEEKWIIHEQQSLPDDQRPPPETAVFGGFSCDPDRGVQTLISSAICSPGSSAGEGRPPPSLITREGGGEIIQTILQGRREEGRFNPSLITTQPFNCWRKSLNEPFNLTVLGDPAEVTLGWKSNNKRHTEGHGGRVLSVTGRFNSLSRRLRGF